jgi:hypothetical protein
MNSDEIQSLIVKVLLMILTPLGTKFGIDGNTVAAIAAWAASGAVLGYGVYSHWNMKKVPENSTAIATARPLPVGAAVGTAISASAKVVGALLIGFLILHAAPALAQKKPTLTGNPVNDIKNAINGGNNPIADATNQNAAAALLQPYKDIANYISGDFDEAIRLAVSVPQLQDGNGLYCLNVMKAIGDLYKQHPPAVTFKAATDWEGLRLLAAGINKVCSENHCSQVFADIQNMIQAASPIPLNIPDMHTLCAKVPVVPMSIPDPDQLKAAQAIQPAAAPAPNPAAPAGPDVTKPQ